MDKYESGVRVQVLNLINLAAQVEHRSNKIQALCDRIDLSVHYNCLFADKASSEVEHDFEDGRYKDEDSSCPIDFPTPFHVNLPFEDQWHVPGSPENDGREYPVDHCDTEV